MEAAPGRDRGRAAGSRWPGTSFIGRERELAALRFLTHAHRLVTVTGIGGAGKTRLVSELTRRSTGAASGRGGPAASGHASGADARPSTCQDGDDRIAFVALASLATADQAAEAIARAFGGRGLAAASTPQYVASLAGPGRALLVLDNCEHLARDGGELAHLVEELLGACPGLHVLATSRFPLRIAGETVWQLPPLPPEAATRLFLDRARNVAPGWAPTGPELAAVGRLCDALAGVPLAIELAAAHAHVVTITQMADSLAHRLIDLRSTRHDASPRQRSMRASLEWSNELLPRDQQILLRRLAVFAGGWQLEDAEAVTADDDLPRERILPALAGLVEAALVGVSASGGVMRYALLELVRQFAAERLETAGERGQLSDRHLARFLELAEMLGPHCRFDAAPTARLRAETANLRTAVEHALGTRPEVSLRLVAALSEFWMAAVGTADPERLSALALEAAPADDPLRGRVLAARSLIAFFRDDIPVALASGEAAVAVGELTGDRAVQCRALTVLALITGIAQTRPGLAMLDRAEGLLDGLADTPELALDAGFVRMLLTGIEEHPEPMRLAADRQQARLAGHRDTLWHAWFFHHRSWISFLTGDETAYLADIRAALAAYEALPTLGVDAFSLGDRAFNLVRTGRIAEATSDIDRARVAGVRSGSVLALGRLNTAIAACHLYHGRPEEARTAIRRSLPSDPQHGMAPALGTVLWLGGTAALVAGDVATARDEASQLATVARDRLGNNPRFGAAAEILLARCALSDGDAASAVPHLRHALATATADGLDPQAEDALDWLGVAAIRLGSLARGLRLIAASGAARTRSGRIRFPADAALTDDAADTAQGALGAVEASAATAQGADATLAEATEYALRGLGSRQRPERGWASLTQSEQRVAHLAAEGLSNAQIADRLFVSVHTVKVHLAHAYTKLEVSGRAQLAAIATAHRSPLDWHGHPAQGS